MYDAELGSHPTTSDSPQQRRGNEQFATAVDSTIEGVERQVVESALVEVQEEVGEFWEQTCRAGPWFFDTFRGRTITVPCNRKTCAICRKKLAVRYTRQIEYEKITHYTIVKSEKWDACWKMLKRKGYRYKSFPTENGVIVVSGMGQEELPDELSEFLDDVIERAARSRRRISGSRGFGGPHRGHRSGEKGRYWRPCGRWSLAEVTNDIAIALAEEKWRLVLNKKNDGFRLIGRRKDNVRAIELGGLVGVGGQVVW